MIDTSSKLNMYSEEILDAAVTIALSFRLEKPSLVQKQAALAFFFNKLGAHSSDFAYLVKYKGKELERQIQSRPE